MDSDTTANSLSTCPHPDCSFKSPADARYCGGCGRLLEKRDKGTQKSNIREPRTPDYLGQSNGEKTLELGSARKQATVMFADVCGSTKLIREDLEGGMAVIMSNIEVMKRVVAEYGGRVTQTLGDGIMAVFDQDGPIPHAASGALAALAIHDAIRKAIQKDSTRPDVQIGLHSDDVIVHDEENSTGVDHIATGASSVAARMEQEASSGTTYISRATERLAEGFIETRSLGLKWIKGFDKQVEIFELVGSTNLTPFEAYKMRGVTPFVGRDTELDVLAGALEASKQRGSRLVSIEGNAGVGKSRLCHEFFDGIRDEKVFVIEANAVARGRIPYAALGSLIRSWLRVSPVDPVKKVESRLNTELKMLGIDKKYRSGLASVLDIPFDDPVLVELDPAQYQHRIFDGLRILMATLCRERYLVILCEDMIWFDSESLGFFDQVIADFPAQRILLILTYRPEFENIWSDKGKQVIMRLESLKAEDGSRREIILSLIGGNSPGLEELRQKVDKLTDGNPFFIEEMVRSLVEDSILVGSADSYELGVPAPDIQLAPSVKSVIEARISRLSPALRAFLEAAAVIGEEIFADDLRAVLNLDENAFHRILVDLFEIGLLCPVRSGASSPFRFNHATVREVAFHSMLRNRQRDLQTRIVRMIEALYAGRLQDQADRLVHHSFEAELWEDAVKYSISACEKATARSANNDAVRVLEKGLDAFSRIPDETANSEEWMQAAIRLRLMGFPVMVPLGGKEALGRIAPRGTGNGQIN